MWLANSWSHSPLLPKNPCLAKTGAFLNSHFIAQICFPKNQKTNTTKLSLTEASECLVPVHLSSFPGLINSTFLQPSRPSMNHLFSPPCRAIPTSMEKDILLHVYVLWYSSLDSCSMWKCQRPPAPCSNNYEESTMGWETAKTYLVVKSARASSFPDSFKIPVVGQYIYTRRKYTAVHNSAILHWWTHKGKLHTDTGSFIGAFGASNISTGHSQLLMKPREMHRNRTGTSPPSIA